MSIAWFSVLFRVSNSQRCRSCTCSYVTGPGSKVLACSGFSLKEIYSVTRVPIFFIRLLFIWETENVHLANIQVKIDNCRQSSQWGTRNIGGYRRILQRKQDNRIRIEIWSITGKKFLFLQSDTISIQVMFNWFFLISQFYFAKHDFLFSLVNLSWRCITTGVGGSYIFSCLVIAHKRNSSHPILHINHMTIIKRLVAHLVTQLTCLLFLVTPSLFSFVSNAFKMHLNAGWAFI